MENKFQKGDKVQFVDIVKPYGGEFTEVQKGKIYEVLKVEGEYVFIKKDNGNLGNFYARRFRKVEQKKVFAVGDEVTIASREVLKSLTEKGYREIENFVGVPNEMYQYAGKKGIITEVRDYTNHFLFSADDGEFYWAWYCCEPVWDIAPEPPKFAIGDKVCVVKKTANAEVVPKWSADMDKTVSKSYKVKSVEKGYVVLSNGFAYHLDSLELFDKEKHMPKKVKPLRNVIAAIRKEAKKAVGGTCSYVMIHEPVKGSVEHVIRKQYRDVCHARLEQYGGAKSKAVAVLDFVGYHDHVKKKNKLAHRAWIDYIQRRSPWAPAYHAKDAKNAIISGLDLNVECSGDAIAGACIAMRMGSEYPELLRRFGEFRKLTDNENVAFLCAYTFSEAGKKYNIAAMAGGHSVLYGMHATEPLLKFFAKGYATQYIKPDGVAKHSYAEKQSYKVFDAMLDQGKCADKTMWSTYVDQNTGGVKKNIGWGEDVKQLTLDDVKAFMKHLEVKLGELANG